MPARIAPSTEREREREDSERERERTREKLKRWNGWRSRTKRSNEEEHGDWEAARATMVRGKEF